VNRLFVSAGAWFALLGVGLGAFGTHGLRGKISAANLDVWHTAVQYHTLHAVALVIVGILCAFADGPLMRAAGWLFGVGILVFGGSLYALAVTDVKILGAITPLGGLCFLAGWGCMAVGVSRPNRTEEH
jgi:uncharacterized membrane protein YgdD (TMEM256/DUF423 family)